MPTVAPRERARKLAPRRKKRSAKQGAAPWAWWPLLLALIVTPFAVRGASVLALSGPAALRLLYPFIALVQAHAPRSLAPEQSETLAAWAMWAQLPIYGVLLSLFTLRRRWLAGLLVLVTLHLLAIGAALAFSR